ncbi:MAG: hypothetical protein AAB972_00135, partial [Patescibacteria group bacterium]
NEPLFKIEQRARMRLGTRNLEFFLLDVKDEDAKNDRFIVIGNENGLIKVRPEKREDIEFNLSHLENAGSVEILSK